MSKKCSIKAHVVNKSGDVVESILFNDLLKFSGNDRKFTNDYYKVATDQEFLDAVRNIAEFDENDEITFKSLKEITNMNISDSKIIRGLDKELGAGLYDQAEAFFKIDAFNTQNKFKKKDRRMKLMFLIFIFMSFLNAQENITFLINQKYICLQKFPM